MFHHSLFLSSNFLACFLHYSVRINKLISEYCSEIYPEILHEHFTDWFKYKRNSLWFRNSWRLPAGSYLIKFSKKNKLINWFNKLINPYHVDTLMETTATKQEIKGAASTYLKLNTDSLASSNCAMLVPCNTEHRMTPNDLTVYNSWQL